MQRRTDAAEMEPLAPGEFEQIRKLAYDTFGLDLKHGKEELVSARLRRLVRNGGHRSFREYYRSIVQDQTGESLIAMIDALATNHTSFLREPEHFDFLRREVLPKLVSRERIELWSAACSTGEEVWTLAMVLREAAPARTLRLFASDISNKALAFAQAATYPAERCQGVPGPWLARYFRAEPSAGRPAKQGPAKQGPRVRGPERQGSGAGSRGPVNGEGATAYCVVPAIRSLASFRRVNLVQPYSWPRPFPIIFCRNVMIYFDRETQERVVRQLAECLEPGGYLFVGHAESLTRISHSLEYVGPAVYRKPGGREGRWARSL